MWEKTPEEISSDEHAKNRGEIQRQTEVLGRFLKVVAEAIAENKTVSVENIVREVTGKVAVERPEWIRELKSDMAPILKKLDYIASAVIRKEVVRKMDLNRPSWLDEIKPKDITFPEAKDYSKPTTDLLEKILKAVKEQEPTEEVSIKGEVSLAKPKWWSVPDFATPLVSLAGALKKYFDKAIIKTEITNDVNIANPVTEVTVKNPQKEVKITNLAALENDVKLITAQLAALGQTGGSGGRAMDTSRLATEEKQDATLFHYKLARLPVPGDTLIYIGYLDKDGNWYITEINEGSGTQKYVKGASGFTTAWSNRASQTYLDFDSIF